MNSEREVQPGKEEQCTGLLVSIPGAAAATFLVGELVDWRLAICVGAFVNMAGMTLVVLGHALKDPEKRSLEGELTGLVISWMVPIAVLAWGTKTPNLLWSLVVLGVLLRGPVLRCPFWFKQRLEKWIKGAAWAQKMNLGKPMLACIGVGVSGIMIAIFAAMLGSQQTVAMAGLCIAVGAGVAAFRVHRSHQPKVQAR